MIPLTAKKIRLWRAKLTLIENANCLGISLSAAKNLQFRYNLSYKKESAFKPLLMDYPTMGLRKILALYAERRKKGSK